MARRFGRNNSYKSPLRKCDRCGYTYYECDMVQVQGLWLNLECVDDDELTRMNRGRTYQRKARLYSSLR